MAEVPCIKTGTLGRELRILLEFVRMGAGEAGVSERKVYLFNFSPQGRMERLHRRDTGIQDARCAWKLGKFGNKIAENAKKDEQFAKSG